ncbi:pyridoxal phosphate-dependent aminotransferase [Corynebacterium testudinoris]|uniref:Succinyldiaminopimelate aminotransferase apoenzyme n=1 Tax=Corynebacterium testudinoris TaxID=136857 RepID=A0A0G3H443_9CORY|nr:pyridoxal phosphate-dependent aminotransferase [Corynebacterium testudinoris]AKK08144.1 succinyldiaminopimelate aminotransferase apoenzyme [Corynebacterium testudinoris]MBX8996854.1 pyridoxal phosphate-dependent aminotransferase [Corynebacterium testudinoris]
MSGREVTRLQPFGETVFATMTELAVTHDAINLGQGFPDSDGPAAMLELACAEISSGNNQYGPGRGFMGLRSAIARQRQRDYGVTYHPEAEVLVTVGATEAISATVLGLVEPGSEVIVLEPYFDAYAAAIALAGATRVAVPLVSAGDTWTVDVDAVRAAITPRTAMVIINSPHNPTGSVFSREVLTELSAVCVENDLLVLSDEVYENLVFDDTTHTALAALPGMWSRTITVSSAAKSYNVTGWKIGWALAPAPLLDAVLKAKQFMTYVGPTPFQPAVHYALDHESAWLEDMVSGLQSNRDLLGDALRTAGFPVSSTAGTYFTVVDIAPLGFSDGVEFCTALPQQIGVAAIPVQVFCDDPEPWRTKVRFAFCKQPATLAEAARRITQLGA